MPIAYCLRRADPPSTATSDKSPAGSNRSISREVACLVENPKKVARVQAKVAQVQAKAKEVKSRRCSPGAGEKGAVAGLSSLQAIKNGPLSLFLGYNRHTLENVAPVQGGNVAPVQGGKITGLRIHDLRRTCGSWLTQNGCSLQIVGRVLNHSSYESTQPYARLQNEDVRAALETHGRLVNSACKTRKAEVTSISNRRNRA